MNEKIKDSKFSTSTFSNFSMSHPLNLGKFESSPVTVVRTMHESQMDKKGTLPAQDSNKNTGALPESHKFKHSKGNSSVFFNSSEIQRSSEVAKNTSKSGSKASI